MSTYKIESIDGGLVLTDPAGHAEWLDDIEIVGFPSEQALAVRLSLCISVDSNLDAYDDDEAADIRADMQKWLDDGYSIGIRCDFSEEKSKAAAYAEATALYNRFRDGDYAPLDALWCASWVSEDGQGSMDADGYIDRPDPAAFVAELLADFGDTAHDRKGLLAGRINLTRYRGHWNRGPEILEDEGFDVADFAPIPEAA